MKSFLLRISFYSLTSANHLCTTFQNKYYVQYAGRENFFFKIPLVFYGNDVVGEYRSVSPYIF
jgi:hypothetical protein